MHILNLSDVRLTCFLYENFKEKVDIFNKAILNKLSDLLSHEMINGRYPPWFNSKVHSLRRQLKCHHDV